MSLVRLFSQGSPEPLPEPVAVAVGTLAVLALGTPIYLCVSALVLRMACEMASVTIPRFPRAFGVEAIVLASNLALSYSLGALLLAMGIGPLSEQGPLLQLNGYASVISIPFGILIAIVVYPRFLDRVSVGKAFLIWTCWFVIWLSVACAMVVALFALAMVAGAIMRRLNL